MISTKCIFQKFFFKCNYLLKSGEITNIIPVICGQFSLPWLLSELNSDQLNYLLGYEVFVSTSDHNAG